MNRLANFTPPSGQVGGDFRDHIVAVTGLPLRDAGVNQTEGAVVDGDVTEANRPAIQAAINSYVHDPDYGKTLQEVRLQATTTLEQWASDAQNAYDTWPSKTAAQKDAAMRVTIERLGTMCARFADLLDHLKVR